MLDIPYSDRFANITHCPNCSSEWVNFSPEERLIECEKGHQFDVKGYGTSINGPIWIDSIATKNG